MTCRVQYFVEIMMSLITCTVYVIKVHKGTLWGQPEEVKRRMEYEVP
jgi:hypothetical protein